MIYKITHVLLRCAIGAGFLLPVMDRLGLFGTAGTANVAWGDWAHFSAYTHQLMPYTSPEVAAFFGLLATAGEIICGILLIIGYKMKFAALSGAGLTLVFALSMLIFLHYRAPFNYSVFVVSFSSLLLALSPDFPWSIDEFLSNRRNRNRQPESKSQSH